VTQGPQQQIDWEGLDESRNARRAHLLSAWDVLKVDVPSLRLECKTFLLKVFEIGGDAGLKKSFSEIALLYLEDDSKNADRAKRAIRYLRQIGLLVRHRKAYVRGTQDANEYRIDWATVVRTLARRELPEEPRGGGPIHRPVAPCDRPIAPCDRPVARGAFTHQVTSSSFSSSESSSSTACAASVDGEGAEAEDRITTGEDASSLAGVDGTARSSADDAPTDPAASSRTSVGRPPRAPASGAARDRGEWKLAERALLDAGLSSVASTLTIAQERGYGPPEVVALSRWFGANRAAFRSPGALRTRLIEIPPGEPVDSGWPPPDAASIDHVAKRARRQQRDAKQLAERIEFDVVKQARREGVDEDAEIARRVAEALDGAGLPRELSPWCNASESVQEAQA
jgi:hypothetical protein